MHPPVITRAIFYSFVRRRNKIVFLVIVSDMAEPEPGDMNLWPVVAELALERK